MQSSMVMFHLERGGRLIYVILAAVLSPLKCSAILARAKFEQVSMGWAICGLPSWMPWSMHPSSEGLALLNLIFNLWVDFRIAHMPSKEIPYSSPTQVFFICVFVCFLLEESC